VDRQPNCENLAMGIERELERTRRAADDVMPLVIAWRNPLPPVRAERKVRRVGGDQFGTVYLVTAPDATQEAFELYPGGGTKSGEVSRVNNVNRLQHLK
jgi:hypothetical protein